MSLTARIAAALLAVGLAASGIRANRDSDIIHADRFQSSSDSQRSIVVASDLHMGEGRETSGEWTPYEDFRWAQDFVQFLVAVDRDGQSAVDLILNGDTFELLQSSLGDCSGVRAGLGCTEAEALTRLERILRAHTGELKALSQFSRKGTNRVVLVPGDHDAALLFPRLARRVITAVDAPAGRVAVAASGYWRSSDGRIYAEHGQQIGSSPHRFAGWPAPFVRRSGVEHLTRPWGESSAQDLLNQFERRFPVIDNVVVPGIGLKYLPAADLAQLQDVAAPLLRYLLSSTPWQQFRMELDDGDVRAPTWDLGQVVALGPSFLVSALPDDDPIKPLAARALAGGHLEQVMTELSEPEIVAVCDYRAAMRRARRRMEPFVSQFPPRGPAVSECPRSEDSRGSVFDYFWRSRDDMFLKHLDSIVRTLPDRRRPLVYVYGHTHLPDRSQSGANLISGGLLKIPMEGFSPIRGALDPVVLNAGAWQRTFTPAQLIRMASARGVSAQDLVVSLKPEELPPCYSFVQIGFTNGNPVPLVRYWRESAGEWQVTATCAQ